MKRNIKIVIASFILIFAYCLITTMLRIESLPMMTATVFIMLQICIVSVFKE